ncbi:MAG: hypothetical protein QM485_01585 [Flavobacteriaceae bacterium]
MKKIYISILSICLILFSCEIEKIDNSETLSEIQAKGNINSKKVNEPDIIRECIVMDVDRCPFGDRQPAANFWWPENETDYFNPATYFSSTDEHQLIFTEYANGTANIKGSTTMGTCVVNVDVWLKDKKSWTEWSALGGGHKKEGCAGDASDEENMNFYIIDSEKSILISKGGDCIAEGTFGLEQRPDPSDINTPNYGAHVGPGGANYDSELGALGLSTWAWITDISTGDRLWIMDFNFTFDCDVKEPECETAFARGEKGDTCFIGNGFNRWGWTIGPLDEGDYSYEVYAGAGQCDTDKGELVGTVDISYSNGEVDVTYNIDAAYSVKETHTYAGKDMFPTNKKGEPTVAPGQYTNEGGFDGTVYVIAHLVVCQ